MPYAASAMPGAGSTTTKQGKTRDRDFQGNTLAVVSLSRSERRWLSLVFSK